MKLQNLIKTATLNILNDKVKKISQSDSKMGEMWEVDNNHVRLFQKKSSWFLTCDCKYCSIHSMSNPICSNKISVIMFEQRKCWNK